MSEKKAIETLLDETSQLVTTLQTLKNEIENYDQAKQNLNGIKETLVGYIDVQGNLSNELVVLIKAYNEKVEQSLEQLLIRHGQLDDVLIAKISQFEKSIEKRSTDSELKVLSCISSGDDQVKSALNEIKLKDLKVIKYLLFAIIGIVTTSTIIQFLL